MKKADEVQLWYECRKRCRLSPDREMPRDVAAGLGIPLKRAEHLFHKWARKGLLNYGVSVGTGWIEKQSG